MVRVGRDLGGSDTRRGRLLQCIEPPSFLLTFQNTDQVALSRLDSRFRFLLFLDV